MEKETWMQIVEFDGYEVSNLGRVRNRKTKKTRKTVINKNTGYEMVMLFGKDRPVNLYVHRLVAEAFLANPYGCNDVDHMNNNKTDNNVTNLRWVFHKDNLAGRGKYSKYKGRRIKQIDSATGTVVAVWSDFVEAARNIGVHPCNIGVLLDKSVKTWTLKGNRFEFV